MRPENAIPFFMALIGIKSCLQYLFGTANLRSRIEGQFVCANQFLQPESGGLFHAYPSAAISADAKDTAAHGQFVTCQSHVGIVGFVAVG